MIFWGNRRLCQATRELAFCVEVSSDEAQYPFIVNRFTARRLRNGSLSPREAFNLAAIFGWDDFRLHEDFYDASDGQAVQPATRVPRRGHDYPSFAESVRNLSSLLDFQGAWPDGTPEDELWTALEAFPNPVLIEAIDERVRRWRHPHVFTCALQICAKLIDGDSEAWLIKQESRVGQHEVAAFALAYSKASDLSGALAFVRRRVAQLQWPPPLADAPPRDFHLPSNLLFAFRDHPQRKSLLPLVADLFALLPRKHLSFNVMGLYDCDDDAILHLIERFAPPAPTYEWGAAAALNRLDRPRARQWLRGPDHLTLVALDALRNLRGYDPQDEHQSGAFQTRQPSLLRPGDQEEIITEVSDAAARLNSKRAFDAVRVITAHLTQIVDPRWPK